MKILEDKISEMIEKWENNILFIKERLELQKSGRVCGEKQYFEWEITVEQNKINLAKKRYNL